MAKRHFEKGDYIPWSDAGDSSSPAPPVNHSGQPAEQADQELLELAAMEAQERARPLGHGKGPYVSGSMVQAGPVERGEPVPSNGVGQETLDGLIEANALEEEKKAAALQGYLTQLAMHNAGRLMGATNRALFGGSFGL